MIYATLGVDSSNNLIVANSLAFNPLRLAISSILSSNAMEEKFTLNEIDSDFDNIEENNKTVNGPLKYNWKPKLKLYLNEKGEWDYNSHRSHRSHSSHRSHYSSYSSGSSA